MAKLVDEGRFRWDTPVVQLFPEFALADATVTPKVTMLHTVCACTGLPRQDMEFLFEFAKATPEMRVASTKGMKPTTGFGDVPVQQHDGLDRRDTGGARGEGKARWAPRTTAS